MKELILLIGLFILYFSGKTQQLNLENQPLFWLKADVGIDTNQWEDQSGNGLHALWKQSLNVNYQSLNFYPAVEINPLNGPLEVSIVLKKKANIKVYAVYQVLDTNSENGIWSIV